MATVLLVEDDHVVRCAMLRSLTDLGHAVDTTGTALEALRRVAASPPDLIVLDLGLPDLDGADALRMLRGISDVPIIIATARDDEADIVRLLRAGADDYMVKPFSSAHLDARMATVLRRTGRASRAELDVIDAGPLRVHLGERQAYLDGAALALTRKEFDLLA
ncbi:MAG TPA: response regulator transcription factor, partial [Micromonosporaceae bacterium]